MHRGLQDWIFPRVLLDKAKLRSLLAHLAQPNAGEFALLATDLRKIQPWAIAANLLDERGLTPEGQRVVTKDPYLEATVTDWLIHFHLSSGERGLWKYIVYEFLPQHPSFTQDDLLNSCTEIFTGISRDKLKKSIRLVLQAYTESQAIAKNRFLTQQKKLYSTGNSDLSNPYTVGYILAKLWEHHFKTRTSVLVDEILAEEFGLAPVLGISEEALRQQLETLASNEIIEQRSAKPHLSGTKPRSKNEHESSYQVYRCWDSPIELLEKAYENDIATPNRPLIQSLGDILDDDDNIPDFSQFLEWVSRLTALDGGSNTIAKLAS
jgi:hypothetical protein